MEYIRKTRASPRNEQEIRTSVSENAVTSSNLNPTVNIVPVDQESPKDLPVKSQLLLDNKAENVSDIYLYPQCDSSDYIFRKKKYFNTLNESFALPDESIFSNSTVYLTERTEIDLDTNLTSVGDICVLDLDLINQPWLVEYPEVITPYWDVESLFPFEEFRKKGELESCSFSFEDNFSFEANDNAKMSTSTPLKKQQIGESGIKSINSSNGGEEIDFLMLKERVVKALEEVVRENKQIGNIDMKIQLLPETSNCRGSKKKEKSPLKSDIIEVKISPNNVECTSIVNKELNARNDTQLVNNGLLKLNGTRKNMLKRKISKVNGRKNSQGDTKKQKLNNSGGLFLTSRRSLRSNLLQDTPITSDLSSKQGLNRNINKLQRLASVKKTVQKSKLPIANKVNSSTSKKKSDLTVSEHIRSGTKSGLDKSSIPKERLSRSRSSEPLISKRILRSNSQERDISLNKSVIDNGSQNKSKRRKSLGNLNSIKPLDLCCNAPRLIRSQPDNTDITNAKLNQSDEDEIDDLDISPPKLKPQVGAEFQIENDDEKVKMDLLKVVLNPLEIHYNGGGSVSSNSMTYPSQTGLGRFSAKATVSDDTDDADIKPKIESDVKDVKNGEKVVYKLGSFVWAQVGKHPYWPAIICHDSGIKNYFKNVRRPNKSNLTLYHTRFFGDKGRRAWIKENHLMLYNSRDDLSIALRTIRLENKRDKHLKPYRCNQTGFAKWKHAVAEIESVKDKPYETVHSYLKKSWNDYVNNKQIGNDKAPLKLTQSSLENPYVTPKAPKLKSPRRHVYNDSSINRIKGKSKDFSVHSEAQDMVKLGLMGSSSKGSLNEPIRKNKKGGLQRVRNVYEKANKLRDKRFRKENDGKLKIEDRESVNIDTKKYKNNNKVVKENPLFNGRNPAILNIDNKIQVISNHSDVRTRKSYSKYLLETGNEPFQSIRDDVANICKTQKEIKLENISLRKTRQSVFNRVYQSDHNEKEGSLVISKTSGNSNERPEEIVIKKTRNFLMQNQAYKSDGEKEVNLIENRGVSKRGRKKKLQLHGENKVNLIENKGISKRGRKKKLQLDISKLTQNAESNIQGRSSLISNNTQFNETDNKEDLDLKDDRGKNFMLEEISGRRTRHKSFSAVKYNYRDTKLNMSVDAALCDAKESSYKKSLDSKVKRTRHKSMSEIEKTDLRSSSRNNEDGPKAIEDPNINFRLTRQRSLGQLKQNNKVLQSDMKRNSTSVASKTIGHIDNSSKAKDEGIHDPKDKQIRKNKKKSLLEMKTVETDTSNKSGPSCTEETSSECNTRITRQSLSRRNLQDTSESFSEDHQSQNRKAPEMERKGLVTVVDLPVAEKLTSDKEQLKSKKEKDAQCDLINEIERNDSNKSNASCADETLNECNIKITRRGRSRRNSQVNVSSSSDTSNERSTKQTILQEKSESFNQDLALQGTKEPDREEKDHDTVYSGPFEQSCANDPVQSHRTLEELNIGKKSQVYHIEDLNGEVKVSSDNTRHEQDIDYRIQNADNSDNCVPKDITVSNLDTESEGIINTCRPTNIDNSTKKIIESEDSPSLVNFSIDLSRDKLNTIEDSGRKTRQSTYNGKSLVTQKLYLNEDKSIEQPNNDWKTKNDIQQNKTDITEQTELDEIKKRRKSYNKSEKKQESLNENNARKTRLSYSNQAQQNEKDLKSINKSIKENGNIESEVNLNDIEQRASKGEDHVSSSYNGVYQMKSKGSDYGEVQKNDDYLLDRLKTKQIDEHSESGSKASSGSSSKTQLYSFEYQMELFKKNNLFNGTRNIKVCDHCFEQGELFKCKGKCGNYFHIECASKVKEPKVRSSRSKKIDGPVKSSSEPINLSISLDSCDIPDKNTLPNDIEERKVDEHVQIITVKSKRAIEAPQTEELPSNYHTMSIVEQIDWKMGEIMKNLEKSSKYQFDSTDTSSEDGSLNMSVKKNSDSNLLQSSLRIDIEKTDISESNKEQHESQTEYTDPQQISTNSNKIICHVTADSVVVKEPMDGSTLKCTYCSMNQTPPCFICGLLISKRGSQIRKKCSYHRCSKYFHLHCLKAFPQTQWTIGKWSKNQDSEDTFTCPSHLCHTCFSEELGSNVRLPGDRLARCMLCPAAFHSTNYCTPAGSKILGGSQIICPRHRNKLIQPINTTWCFICSEGGKLVCCDTCPTSVHPECQPITLTDDDKYICEDCESGRFPLYDEVVWVKLGHYKWWPALVLFPNETPESVKAIKHNTGDFAVRFFGTDDYYWVNKARSFLFEEGDRGASSGETLRSKNKVYKLYEKAIDDAALAFKLKREFKLRREAESISNLKHPFFVKINKNKPVGKVKLSELDFSNVTPCECDPKKPHPCGPDSDCINRLLMTECDPDVCLAGTRCRNQVFQKREYMPVIPYKTQGRGWGLKCLTPIKNGQFIIEYVGELIDSEEYQRRIRKMHAQKDENYYFMTVDSDRMIDAGPKGNFSRFMNHSCDPNCITQKWTVKGDTRVGIFANCDIETGSELTFNYNLEVVGQEKKICKCGASGCTGYIGLKAKSDKTEPTSEVKPPAGKIRNTIKKKSVSAPTMPSCFLCKGRSQSDLICNNKACNKGYHLKCLKLEEMPEVTKFVCPRHNCNICSNRTIRCCVKCINSFCPSHAESNVRHDKFLGFVCRSHDPGLASHQNRPERKLVGRKIDRRRKLWRDYQRRKNEKIKEKMKPDNGVLKDISININVTESESNEKPREPMRSVKRQRSPDLNQTDESVVSSTNMDEELEVTAFSQAYSLRNKESTVIKEKMDDITLVSSSPAIISTEDEDNSSDDELSLMERLKHWRVSANGQKMDGLNLVSSSPAIIPTEDEVDSSDDDLNLMERSKRWSDTTNAKKKIKIDNCRTDT
ncbi:uncharacterized protein LOC115884634 isoform X2 [Sitophilus oryzae]|uniref:Uncharacterized protein LOC115884634 isoform X2 n=1 Tax=Sitophilus oryzae TaxID=7048 RepID=A0A6J2Y7Q8_SITOR|nr:uncharacterized protein LOC115884634 isoform X2 [Sitophilus oryzae]